MQLRTLFVITTSTPMANRRSQPAVNRPSNAPCRSADFRRALPDSADRRLAHPRTSATHAWSATGPPIARLCTTRSCSEMRAAGTHDIGTAERRLAMALIVAAAFLRALYAFRYRVDTDEPQHLHVAWAWAHGLVQYRDVFDNHMPLFHLLTAPLVRALGERADIVPVMRLAMLPGYALVLWCTYRLGRR